MKKNLLLILLSVLCVAVLIFCFSSKEPQNPDDTVHTHTEVEIAEVPATCTEAGLTAGKKCSVCEEIIVVQEEVEALGHDEVEHEAKEGSCLKIGWEAYVTCSRCDYTTYEELNDFGHAYNSEDKCDVCGLDVIFSEGLEFALINNDTEYEVWGIGTCTDTDIYVPREYNSKPVTRVADFAFKDNVTITGLRVPSSVKVIGCKAFDGCSALINVDLSSGVEILGDDAFKNCPVETAAIPTAAISYIPKASLKRVVITNGDIIENSAFSDCGSLVSVKISDSVTSIGASAFSGTQAIKTDRGISYVDKWIVDCDTAITAVKIKDGTVGIADEAFSGCIGLISVTIPRSVTSIGASAFSGCTAITSIAIPDSVMSIGENAFDGCSILESISVSKNNTQYSNQDGILYNKDKTEFVHIPSGIVGDIVIPSTITVIHDKAFYECIGLTSVTILNGVTSIGEYAFSGCEVLTTVTILNSETNIGNYAFKDCIALTTVTLGSGVTSIDNHAFEGCIALESITIPDSVISIGDSAFSGCEALTNVTIPSSVTNIGNNAFKNCTLLTNVTMVDGLKSIGSHAFEGCTELTDVTVPSSVTSIGSYAFKNCSSITTITIPDGMKKISDHVFSGCTALTIVKLPNSIRSIGDYAFKDCGNITEIYFDGTNEEWDAVVKGEGWDENTGNYTVYTKKADTGEIWTPSLDL